MSRSHRALLLLGPLLLPSLASAQQPRQLSLATVIAEAPRLVRAMPRGIWRHDGHGATVVTLGDDGGERLSQVEGSAIVEPPLCTAAELRKALGSEPGEAPARFPAIAWHDADTLRVELDTEVLHWRLGEAKATRVLAWPQPEGDQGLREPLHAIAPGDGHVALRRGAQLWLSAANGALRQLTFDGSDDVVYGGAAHRAEFGIDRGMFWSPDGRYLAFYREDLRQVAGYPYQDLDAMPPAVRHGRYPMAGRTQGRVTVRVCDTEGYAVTTLATDVDADEFSTNVAWAPGDADADGEPWRVQITVVDRAQANCRLDLFSPESGQRLATLVHESDEQWIEPEHPALFLDAERFLWWSRRSGHRHLWLYDPARAEPRQVTEGPFDVQQVLAFDVRDDGAELWFVASGVDPRQQHAFVTELRFGSAGAVSVAQRRVTQERGTHELELAPDRSSAFATWSNLERAPELRLLDTANGAPVPLPAGADPLAAFALPQQRFFETQADDGAVLYGHVALPPDLRAGERRPVLLYVYGGPHVQQVKDTWLGGAPLWLQAFAAEGYVVCRLDNRGTPNRGEQFEQAIWRQLGTCEVKDQMQAVAWLRQQPFVDAERIGVHGWSFGGYMTLRLMLLHPETFACGVSGAPVTDWALYETGYGERYMDTPAENPDGYRDSSCLPLAGMLQRPLLLVHGTDDRTVMWAHTLRFVDACVAAGVDLDYFPYPMQLHGLRGKDRVHFLQKMRRFLGRELRPEDRGVVGR